MPAYYPVYLDLTDKLCLVIGGGTIAEDKIDKLKGFGAKISVISPDLTPSLEASAARGELEWHPREYRKGDLHGVFLGIAATNRREVNESIFREAMELGVLMNVVDKPDQCSFIAPSVVKRGEVTLAISTGGASPALARKLREELSACPTLEWADLADVLAEARKEVKDQRVAIDRQRWQCAMTPELLQLVQSSRDEEALDTLLSNLFDPNAPGLCQRVDKCGPETCARSLEARD
jgi:precorrin-2 dehydrogenase/sirohydrochlorin ferrochelatase